MKFPCPHCGQRMEADADMIGMQFNCPNCSQPLTVPAIAVVAVAVPPRIPPVIPPVMVLAPSCVPDLAPSNPNAFRCAIATKDAAVTMSFDVMELVEEMKKVLEKRLLKKGIPVHWQASTDSAGLQLRLVSVDQGNQFLRWLIPFVAPAVLELEGQIAFTGKSPEPFHYIQRAHFGLFGGTPRSMLKICASRVAVKIAKDVLRVSAS